MAVSSVAVEEEVLDLAEGVTEAAVAAAAMPSTEDPGPVLHGPAGAGVLQLLGQTVAVTLHRETLLRGILA
eukprot:6691297-Prymnesium_polylepis.2